MAQQRNKEDVPLPFEGIGLTKCGGRPQLGLQMRQNCSSPVAFESMYVFEWLQNLRSWAPAIIAHHGDLARHSLENMAEGLTHLIRANVGHVQAARC